MNATKSPTPAASLAQASAIFGVAGMLWLMWSGVRHGIWVDSDVYAMGGRITQHGGDLYRALTSEGLPFTYSPFAALLFVPLSLLGPTAGRTALTTLSLACYLLVVVVLSRRLALPTWKTIVLAGVVLALEPMERNLLLGQINVVLMAMVVCDWLLLPPRYRGYLTGLAVGIKITPAAFVAVALLQRRWAVVGRMALGFFASLLVGSMALPAASLSYWSGGFMGLTKFGPGVTYSDNQSLLASWLRLTGAASPSVRIQVITLLVGMGLGVGAAWLELRRERADCEVAAVAWVALGSLLGSPISWSHHWIWFTLALGVLFSRGRYVQFGIMSVVMWYPTIWVTYAATHDVLALSLQQRILSCAYTIIALFVLFSVLLRLRGPDQRFTPGSNNAQHLVSAESAVSARTLSGP